MSSIPTKLGDLCSIITKGTTPTSIGFEFSNSGVRFLRVQNIFDGKVKYDDDTLFISEDVHDVLRRSQIAPGDILISIAGSIGRTGIVPNDAPELNCNQAVAILRTTEKVYQPFLRHWLESAEAQRQMRGATVTGTIQNLSLSQIGELRIPIPPLPEQRRIAAILDKADALRAKRREALAQLDRLAQSIFVEMFGDPVTNSKGWNLAPLPEATDFQEGPGILAKDFREEGIPLVRLAGMGGAEVSLRGCNFVEPEMFNRKWLHFALEEGDILVLTSATFGNPTVVGKEAVGALCYTGIIRFRPKGEGLNATYLRHYLASPWFLRQATALASGAVIKHFGPTHLRQMTIPVPPFSLQQQFATRTAALESLRIQANAAAAAMEQLFASVQQQAFRGAL